MNIESLFIFAIDPGINHIGWSYIFYQHNIEIEKIKIRILKHGILNQPNKKNFPEKTFLEKMQNLFFYIRNIVENLYIDSYVIEETIVNINPFTSLKLAKGQTCGICSCFTNEKNVYVYGCRSVRKTILKHGGASKKDVKDFLQTTMSIPIRNEHILDSIITGMHHGYCFFTKSTTPEKKSKVKKTINKKKKIQDP